MRAFLIVALLVCASTAQAAPSRRMEPRSLDPVTGAGLPPQVSSWHGGPNSLPYNVAGAPYTLYVDHALGLQGVQLAMEEFGRRGYLRRADMDTAFTSPGTSVVVIAYEQPGRDPMERQPIVFAQSFAVEYPDGWWPVTAISGMVVRDSSATDDHVSVICPEDSTFTVVAVAPQSALQLMGIIDSTEPPGWYSVPGAWSMREAMFDAAWRCALTNFNLGAAYWGAVLQSGAWKAADAALFTAAGARALPPGARLGMVGGAMVAGMGSGILDHLRRNPFPQGPKLLAP